MANIMVVEVTEEDIAEGLVRSSQHCPIARAVSRISGVDGDVSVGSSIVAIWQYMQPEGSLGPVRRRTLFVLPEKAQEFIDQFDDGKPVAPMTIELTEYPESANRKGRIDDA